MGHVLNGEFKKSTRTNIAFYNYNEEKSFFKHEVT